SYAARRLQVRGERDEIWEVCACDQYVNQPLSGDGQIVARVVSLANTQPFAKAGVMIRESAAANAAHVVLDVRPTGGVEFMTRNRSEERRVGKGGTSRGTGAGSRREE